MGDFFPGGWQLDFDLLKHGGETYRIFPAMQTAN
jgi:hypothetical protein